MKLNRWLLSGLCVTCLPMTSSWASPQSDDNKITVVVRVNDDEQASTDDEKAAAAPKIWLGIGLKAIEGDLATYLGSSDGVFIEQVFPDSPAEAAKLKEGDIVVEFQGKKVAGPAELVEALRGVTAAESTGKDDAKTATYPTVVLTVLRRGEDLKVELTPVDRPEHLKIASLGGDSSILNGANIFKFGEPGTNLKLLKPFSQMQSNVVIVVKEDGKEFVARVERDGDEPPKITVTQDKEERTLSEDQLDQLPEKVREAIKKALKAQHSFEFKESKNVPEDADANDLKRQALDEVHEQLEKAMKQVGGGKLDINLKGLTESLKGLGEGRVIIVDPAKLQELQAMSEGAKDAAKKWAEGGVAGVRAFSSMPEQIKELKSEVEDLKKQVEELKALWSAKAKP